MPDNRTPAQKSMQGMLGAHASWANTEDRSARTAAARKKALLRFEQQVDPDGVLHPAERAVRAAHAPQGTHDRGRPGGQARTIPDPQLTHDGKKEIPRSRVSGHTFGTAVRAETGTLTGRPGVSRKRPFSVQARQAGQAGSSSAGQNAEHV